MQALTYSKYGDEHVLELSEVPVPRLGEQDVLINNHYSSINPIDWKIRRGMLRPLSGWSPPKRCGSDFAGKVIAVGTKVQQYHVGDRVYGFVNPIKGGGFSQQLAVPQSQLALIPDDITDQQAGVIPLAALTAFTALKKLARLCCDQRVLINGGSGGVGVMAVQIAKQMGAKVIAVCSEKNRSLLLSLGADDVLDYQQPDYLKSVKNIDVFFDVVSLANFQHVQSCLTDAGIYIKTLPHPITWICDVIHNWRSRQKRMTVLVKPDGSMLHELNEWLSKGQVRPVIERVYPLAQCALAQKHSEAGHVQGKLAIDIQSCQSALG